jgi:hypothetical protein
MAASSFMYGGAADGRWSRSYTRLLVDNAALITDAGDQSATWIPNDTVGPDWLLPNSTFLSMPDSANKTIAVCGISKSDLGSAVCIGVAAAVINNSSGRTAWGLYSDIQHESGSNQTFGLEVAAKNKGADSTAHPYTLGGGVYGVWLAGGGDNAYGGSPANPSNTAIVILSNDHTWNKGIVFEAGGLTGADGSTGTGVAIEMAKGHLVQWRNSNGTVANIGIEGTGADVDISFTPAGTGRMRFGTHTGIAAETVTGYITIKDSGGTSRKLAVVS